MAQQNRADLRTRIATLCGFSLNLPTSVSGPINEFLFSSQQTLYRRYRFEDLRKKDTFATVVGDTSYPYTDIAADCERREITGLAVDVNGQLVPLEEGIDWKHDSIADNQYWPQRYDRLAELEIWPQPNAIYTVHVEYYAALGAFTNDTHLTTVDSELVFLAALVKAKTRWKQADAGVYAQELAMLLHDIKVAEKGEKRFQTSKKRKGTRDNELHPPPTVVV